MIPPEKLYRLLQSRGIGLFAGVPDSLLANFCAYVDDNGEDGSHVITAWRTRRSTACRCC